MHNAYALLRVENWFSIHRSNQLAISWNVNSLWFLSSLPDASRKSLLKKLGFGYMLSPMVAYTSRIIMQAIPARVILTPYLNPFSGWYFLCLFILEFGFCFQHSQYSMWFLASAKWWPASDTVVLLPDSPGLDSASCASCASCTYAPHLVASGASGNPFLHCVPSRHM